jgi:hypothetical protein
VTRAENSRIPQSRITLRVVVVRHPSPYHLVIDVDGHIVRIKISWLNVNIGNGSKGCRHIKNGKEIQHQQLDKQLRELGGFHFVLSFVSVSFFSGLNGEKQECETTQDSYVRKTPLGQIVWFPDVSLTSS